MSILYPFLGGPLVFATQSSSPKLKTRYGCCFCSFTLAQNLHPTTSKPSLCLDNATQKHYNHLVDWPQLLQNAIDSKCLLLGLAMHACLVKLGSQYDVFGGNNLVNMYAKFTRLDDAQKVFDEMPVRNTITWTSLMNGYTQIGGLESVFQVASQMHRSGERFNEHTCSVILQACRSPTDQSQGELIHGLIIKGGFQANTIVGTALVAMYSRIGSLDNAETVFADLGEIDIRCWNSMILGYMLLGDSKKAVLGLCSLLDCGLEPNLYTFTNVISACKGNASLGTCWQLHALALKYGFVSEISVGNAIIMMYGENGLVDEADRVFYRMIERNLISWNAILSAYLKKGYGKRAIDAFVRFLNLGIHFDSSCLATALDACSSCGNVELGFQIHGLSLKLGYLSDVFVRTALIDTYARCGKLELAMLVFSCLAHQNIISFNALLSGYIQKTCKEEEDVMVLFNRLRYAGIKPDSATFTQLLSLSADQASIVKGKCLHGYAMKVGCKDATTVSNALISMYAKCGNIDGACQIFSDMTTHDPITWNAMISAYALHGYGKKVLFLFEEMERNGYIPDEITLLSTLQACCYSGLYDDGIRLFSDMERRYGIKPGIEHRACMVDLLGRAGNLSLAMEFIKESSFAASALLWRTLVNACRLQRDLNIGRCASEYLLSLAPDAAASYILVSDLYAKGGMFEESANIRVIMKDRKIRKEVGCSWIEINNHVYKFGAGAVDQEKSREIYAKLDELNLNMKGSGYPC